MAFRIEVLVCALTLFSAARAAAGKPPADNPSCKDHPLFSRMQGYYLLKPADCVEKTFDGAEFYVQEGKKAVPRRVEGHFFQYQYTYRGEGEAASGLEVIRNFQNAVKGIGGQVQFDNGKDKTSLLVHKDGREIWALVFKAYNKQIHLTIVEPEAMKQQVIANAAALGSGLEATGHVEVPGIFFDTGKSEVKPESDPALAEIAKLLTATPGLQVWVVGHTDSVGGAESNVALASARAAAVVKVLVDKHGVQASRLLAHGVGPYAPVASNANEDGRAKNRRVELVAR